VIGSIDDLRAATVDDVAAFFKMYYAPNNAVLAIVGDVKTAECLAKVPSTRGDPAAAGPAEVDVAEPPQTEEGARPSTTRCEAAAARRGRTHIRRR